MDLACRAGSLTLCPILPIGFMLRNIEQMSTAETSACLGLTPETVKVRLLRALRMLRERALPVHERLLPRPFSSWESAATP